MSRRFLVSLALMLCVGALLFSFPAYATVTPGVEDPIQPPQDEPIVTPPPDEPIEQPEPPAPEPTPPALPGNAFTPDGTGTVMDNAAEVDGKEFFTIKTDDGSVFYLIIDRRRSGENVYLLTAVTEKDLASMAKDNGQTESGIPTVEPPSVSPPPEPSPEPSPKPQSSGGAGSGTVIFIIIAALAVGIAGYYFKIVKPKRHAQEEDYEDWPDDDGDGLGKEEENV